jgi:serine/threonine-protein kinase
MEAERWARLKAIFQAALELPPLARETLLRERCAGDADLHERLRALLAAHETGSDLFEGRGVEAVEELRADLQGAVEGLRLGSYKLLAELGRGGMGTVYLAERDDRTFQARVAIKLIKRGMDTDEIVRRFVNERQILADLVHPNIARLLDGGTTPDGRPYFVLEHIEGRPITDYARGLGVEALLALFLQVASAVQFAHQNLVVHRDLKPANILVGSDGTPKLLDFGIAKLLGNPAPEARREQLPEARREQLPEARPEARFTATAMGGAGAPPMTPDYASPEQRVGGPVTTATDVYALGLLLFELLTGVGPADLERRLGGGWRGRSPGPVPSQVARQLARRDGRFARRLSGDLDAIVAKALEPDPQRRYGTAAELADDLRRHLDRLPVRARRPTLPYRLGRAVRRHKLAAAFAASLVLFGAAASWQAIEVARQRDRAEAQRRRAEALSSYMTGLFRVADPEQNRGAAVTARELLDAGAAALLDGSGAAPGWLPAASGGAVQEPATRALLLHEIGKVYQSLGLFDPAERTLRRAIEIRGKLAGSSPAAVPVSHAPFARLLAPARPARVEPELDLAASLTELAHVRRKRGAFADSAALYRRGLELRRRLLGAWDPRVAESLNGLGLLYAASGDTRRAEESLRRAAAIRRRGGTVTALELAESLDNLATLAIDGERPAAAAAWLDEALAIHRRLLGRDDPRAAVDLSNLAGLFYRRGDYAGAEERFRQALALRRRVLDPGHPDIALTLSNLGAVEYERGRLAEAEASLREALALARRLHSEPNPDVANAMNNLAAVLRERGAAAEAERLYAEALGVYTRLYGARHAMIANTLNNLARARQSQGDFAGAERLARRALSMRRELLGAEHPAVALSLTTLAALHQKAGRLGDSEAAYRQALRIQRQALGARHPAVAATLVGLGNLLVDGGRAREAEPLLGSALGILRAALPAGHASIANAQGALGACYTELGRLHEAAPLLAASHHTLLAARGAGHPDTELAALRLRRLAARRADVGSVSSN